MDLEILYQDEEFVAVNKPGGLLVHRSKQSSDRVFLLQELSSQLAAYLYPVHRLDRACSGVMVFAFSSDGARRLQEALNSPDASKRYLTLVRGDTELEGEMARPLSDEKGQRKACLTLFKKLQYWSRSSLLKVTIKTGRRHQIRRHMAHLAHHVIGDTTYGKGKINRAMRAEFGLPRLFLHAHELTLPAFGTNQGMTIRAPLFADLRAFLLRLPDADPEFVSSL
jgi:tRNA pseudouridine65 synthase